MKSLKISILVLTLAAITAGANAQTKTVTSPSSDIRLSIGADAGIPTGNLSNGYNWNLGGSAQLEVPLTKQLSFTLNGGYDNIFGKKNVTLTTATATSVSTFHGDVTNIQLLPVKAGLKFFPVNNFYIQGEAGADFLLNKADLGYTKSTAFVYAPQIGVLFPVGAGNFIDAGVRYEGSTKFADYSNSTINLIALRLAYSFKL